MPLSIKNLTNQEVLSLTQCNLATEILAVKVDAEGGPKLVKLSREDVTCWQLFLRLFNCGKLAKLQVHLRDVASHLNQYDWQEAKILNNQSELYKAYSKVALLANKALSKGDETLYRNVGLVEIRQIVDHTRYRGDKVVSRLAVSEGILWNPALQVKHVRALLENRHRNHTIRIEDANHQAMLPETNLPLKALEDMRIFLEQRESLPQPAPSHHNLPRKKDASTQTV